jgi:hypothetical protein
VSNSGGNWVYSFQGLPINTDLFLTVQFASGYDTVGFRCVP